MLTFFLLILFRVYCTGQKFLLLLKNIFFENSNMSTSNFKPNNGKIFAIQCKNNIKFQIKNVCIRNN